MGAEGGAEGFGDVASTAARGGYVGMAAGGISQPQPMVQAQAPVAAPPPGPQSYLGNYLAGNTNPTADLHSLQNAPAITAKPQEVSKGPDLSALAGDSASDKAIYSGASALGAAAMAARGGDVDFRNGGKVAATKPSERATKPGNSYANDKVKALLSEGEVVLPRSVMQSKDPARSAADFVMKVLAKRKVS